MSAGTAPVLDKWASWLLHSRYGGSREYFDFVMTQLGAIRDRIFSLARISRGDTVLDVGAGDGILGFAALAQVGGGGKVILSDISADALRHCSEFIAAENGNAPNISTLLASADDLSALGAGSIDVIVSRAVLCYIGDKRKCFDEYFRVLRPGGRLSICEPINRFANMNKREGLTLFGYDMTPLPEIHKKIQAFYGGPPDLEGNPMLNFDERDLLRFAIDAGFENTTINFEASRMRRQEKWTWEQLIGVSNNPNAPSVKAAMDSALNTQEKEELEAYLKPLMEKESGMIYNAGVYLYAVKA